MEIWNYLFIIDNYNRISRFQRCFIFIKLQTFKNDIAADGHHKPLTIYTYIRFLDEIEKYIPNTQDRTQKSSSICTLE
jgi:hypothetical protein